MKFLVLALLVAAIVAAPVPEDDNGDAVELIVNGVPEGTPLELGGIVDLQMKEHVNGQVVASTNLLHPFTAVGIAEAEANAPTPIEIVQQPESDHQMPDAIQLPEPAEPDFIPESVVIPEPIAPEVLPSPIELPSPVLPEVIPEAIVMPDPIPPMVIPELPKPIPEPAGQGPGDIFDNDLVQVQVNAPQDSGMFSTLQNWFSLVVNYISNGIQTSQQIV